MRLREPGQHGADGLLPRAQAGTVIGRIYGILDWWDTISLAPSPTPTQPSSPYKQIDLELTQKLSTRTCGAFCFSKGQIFQPWPGA